MAGAWMRPGYMMPMFDQEAGSGSDALVQFAIDFSNQIYASMRIRPCMYINGGYSSTFQGASQTLRDTLAKPAALAPSVTGPAFPMLWNARYSNNDAPNDIPIQTGNPKTTYTTSSGYYGPWDDYGNTEPWSFWQYASTVSIPGINNVDSDVDSNVSHGDIEYVRNFLVPAVWWTDTSGDWSTLANWNSGQTPVAPVTGAGQTTPYATGGLPTPRLPGAAGTGPTSGQYDTVILERPTANITVTLSTGSHNIRKLYMRETLNLTGGSLTVNYSPKYRPDTSTTVLHGGPVSAQFSGAVTLSGSASLSAHTVQVDSSRTFTISGGTFTFNTLNLMPGTTAGKLLISGNASISALTNSLATIKRGTGTGSLGLVDLGGSARTVTIGNGTSDVDLSIEVPVINGGLVKTGPGTLSLGYANTFAAGTTVSAGRLLVNNVSGSATGSGAVIMNGGTLGGTGIISGVLTLNSGAVLAPGLSIGTLRLGSSPVLNGTVVMEINRNNGAPLADRLVVSSGALAYGGTLTVQNLGAALTGGEVFTLFSAPAYSGTFDAFNLPALAAGMNWYTGSLTNNGTLAVNRQPDAPALLRFTNTAPNVLQIPFALLSTNAADPDLDPLQVVSFDPVTTNGVALWASAGSLFYSNRTSVVDQFSYALSDGRGGATMGLVQIVNIGSTPSAQFAGMPRMAAGSIHLSFSATPGWTYYLERSTDLSNWKTIATNVAPASGLFEFTDSFSDLPAPAPEAFYRLTWPE
jgi:autotransporter-associated beta strand protein